MKTENILLLAALGVGGYFLIKKMNKPSTQPITPEATTPEGATNMGISIEQYAEKMCIEKYGDGLVGGGPNKLVNDCIANVLTGGSNLRGELKNAGCSGGDCGAYDVEGAIPVSSQGVLPEVNVYTSTPRPMSSSTTTNNPFSNPFA